MNLLKSLAMLMLLAALSLAGCKEKTPAEKAADAVKDGAKEAGEKVGEAAEKAGDAVKDATK